MKLVSVIVPVYNIPSQLLSICIESLLTQTYPQLEIILVDDGSPDEGGVICDKYKNIDNRVIVLHNKNAGVSAARNSGLEIASGDYIMFVDADDCLASNAVYNMMVVAQRENADIVICDYLRFFKEVFEFHSSSAMDYQTFKNDDELISMRKKCLVEDNTFGVRFNGAPWGKLYKKEVAIKGFREDLVRSQDNYFNFQVFGLAKSISFLNQKLYGYRFLPSSSVNKFRNNLYSISSKYLKSIENLIKEDKYAKEYFEVYQNVEREKTLEFCTTYIAHSDNKSKKSDKILALRKVKENWLNDVVRGSITQKHLGVYQSILMKQVLKEHFYFVLYFSKVIVQLKYFYNLLRRL